MHVRSLKLFSKWSVKLIPVFIPPEFILSVPFSSRHNFYLIVYNTTKEISIVVQFIFKICFIMNLLADESAKIQHLHAVVGNKRIAGFVGWILVTSKPLFGYLFVFPTQDLSYTKWTNWKGVVWNRKLLKYCPYWNNSCIKRQRHVSWSKTSVNVMQFATIH